MPEYLTIPELADLIRTPAKTLEHWRLHGEGPAFVRLPKRVLYPRHEVERFIADHLVAR